MSNKILEQLRGGIVVSCQAYPGEILRRPEIMDAMAQAAVTGGAVGIRAQGLADCQLIRSHVDVPVIGLWKDGHEGIYITPTVEHAVAVAQTGVQIVATDGTRRPRADGYDLAETVQRIKQRAPHVLLMADCGSLGDVEACVAAGFDLVGTTLAGYTPERERTDGPDWELIEQAIAASTVPVVVEGRIHTPADAARALQMGAHCVVVGTAITHPTSITSWFVKAAENR